MRYGLSISRLGVLAAGLLVCMSEAMACGSGKLILEEKFESLDPAWGFSDKDDTRKNGPDGLTYTLQPGDNIFLLNQASLYNDYEVCAVFTTEAPAEAGTYVAVDVWGTDADNVYEVDILPISGSYSVYRFQNKKMLKPVPLRSHESIAKGASATNELSVAVKGNKGSITINGKKVADFTGQPPEGGSLFGVNFGTLKQDSGPSTVTVKSVQLRELEPSAEQASDGKQ